MGALEVLVISTLIVGAIFMFVISVSELFR
jgi:hypothetical protein